MDPKRYPMTQHKVGAGVFLGTGLDWPEVGADCGRMRSLNWTVQIKFIWGVNCSRLLRKLYWEQMK